MKTGLHAKGLVWLSPISRPGMWLIPGVIYPTVVHPLPRVSRWRMRSAPLGSPRWLKDELLDGEIFYSLHEAHIIIEPGPLTGPVTTKPFRRDRLKSVYHAVMATWLHAVVLAVMCRDGFMFGCDHESRVTCKVLGLAVAHIPPWHAAYPRVPA